MTATLLEEWENQLLLSEEQKGVIIELQEALQDLSIPTKVPYRWVSTFRDSRIWDSSKIDSKIFFLL
jgi:hypothetical protein